MPGKCFEKPVADPSVRVSSCNPLVSSHSQERLTFSRKIDKRSSPDDSYKQ